MTINILITNVTPQKFRLFIHICKDGSGFSPQDATFDAHFFALFCTFRVCLNLRIYIL